MFTDPPNARLEVHVNLSRRMHRNIVLQGTQDGVHRKTTIMPC